MIVINDKKDCCGCTACASTCPVKAITMARDEEGFYYPKVDEEKCINCNLCNRVCPMLNTNKGNIKIVYGAHTKDNDLLLKSSSGGVFGELAKYILSQKGVIFGVDDNYKYVMVSQEKKLDTIFKSKYVQAIMDGVFSKVKEQLDNDKYVLFVGTPCAINGLKNYLQKEYYKLYTCDFICHGVPSIKMVEEYSKAKGNVKRIDFRDKGLGWRLYRIAIETENEKCVSFVTDDEYMNSFLRDYNLRYSCYECKAKGDIRRSDVTIGDYWGIDKESSIYNYYGNSMVIINNSKGKELFANIKDNLIYEEVKKEELIKNPSYDKSPIIPDQRKDFYQDIDSMSWKRFCKKYKLGPKGIRKIKIKIKNMLKG